MTTVGVTARGFRAEIQALRALAVAAVILFHLWPNRVPGGYVGVDVFFVISGFLITDHLLREVRATGRIELGAFWARRIRRLLPAALLVLGATLVGVLLIVPEVAQQRMLVEIGVAALYSLNWVLASNAVDYFAAENAATPVQHYWSLAVEEQFYLLWPLLLLGLVLLAVRLRRPATSLVLVGVVLVGAGSLLHSVIYSYSAPSAAYFSTFTHAWEFALGALAAVGGARLAERALPVLRARAAASWLGIAAILVACFAFDGSTVFPGWTALVPTLGALLVILAGGAEGTRLSPLPLLRWRPVQFLGDVSYSAYLWHWPPIVLLPIVLGTPLDARWKIGLAAATLVLAYLTKRFVEDPVRFARALARRRRFAFSIAVGGAVVLAAASAIPWFAIEAKTDAAVANVAQLEDRVLSGDEPCFGAAAALSGAECPDSHVPDDELVLATEFAAPSGQIIDAVIGNLEISEFGDASSDTTIALVGDSHAAHYLPALRALAAEHGWKIWVIRANSCSPSTPTFSSTWSPDRGAGCIAWREDLYEILPTIEEIDLVVTSSVAPRYGRTETPEVQAQVADAFAAMWTAWTDGGKPVVVIADVPGPGVREASECVAASEDRVDPCAAPRAEVLERDPMVVAARERPLDGVELVDFTDVYCTGDVCHSVIGGIVAYGGGAHISRLFAVSLTPYLEGPILDQLEKADQLAD